MIADTSFLITESDSALVRRLVDEQFPEYSHLSVQYRATGWDNVMFALGDEFAVRLPRRPEAFTPQRNEFEWLNVAATPLTTSVPHIRRVAEPTPLFPHRWAIVDWMEGIRSMSVPQVRRDTCAAELGRQLALLHRPAPHNAPINPYRGVALAARKEVVGERIKATPALAAIGPLWDSALRAEPNALEPVWCHGDLHPGNYILDSSDQLAGIIDFGDITSGDPAVDLTVAWLSFTRVGRDSFFTAYLSECDPRISSDPGLIERAKGWVISTFVSSVLTSELSTPDFVDTAHWAMSELLAEA